MIQHALLFNSVVLIAITTWPFVLSLAWKKPHISCSISRNIFVVVICVSALCAQWQCDDMNKAKTELLTTKYHCKANF